MFATAVLAVAHRTGGRTFRPALTALDLLGAAFAISLLVNVPINAEQLTCVVQAPPPDWASVRDQWQLSHVARTGATLLALGCLCAAALQTPTGRPAPALRTGVRAGRQSSR